MLMSTIVLRFLKITGSCSHTSACTSLSKANIVQKHENRGFLLSTFDLISTMFLITHTTVVFLLPQAGLKGFLGRRSILLGNQTDQKERK